MPQNPFSNNVHVKIEGDGSSLVSATNAASAGLLSLKTAALGVGAVLGGALVLGIKKSVDNARELNAEIRELTKVTDASTAQVLADEMRELSQTIPLTTTELTSIATEAARFGVASEDVSEFTETVAKLAFATDLSVDQAGQAFAKLANLTNTPISSIENLGSAINLMGQTTATSSREIVDGMLRSSAALTQLGVGASDIVALQASLNAVSESSERAGTRLRRLAQEMLDPGKVEALAGALGMTTSEFISMRNNDPTGLIVMMADAMAKGGTTADQLRAELTTVSQQALAGFAQNLDGVRTSLNNSSKEFGNATTLTREFGIEANSLDANLQLLRNRLFNMSAETGQRFVPALNRAVIAVNEFLGRLEAGESSINRVQNALASRLTPALAVLSTATRNAMANVDALWTAHERTVVNSLRSIARSIQSEGQRSQAALTSIWNSAINAVVREFQQATPAINASLEQWRATVTRISTTIITQTTAIWSKLEPLIRAVMTGIWRHAVEPALRGISQLWDRHGSEIMASVAQLSAFTMRAYEVMINTVLTVTRAGVDAATFIWRHFGDEITAVAKFAFDTVGSVIGAALDAILTLFDVTTDIMAGDWESALSKIADLTARIFDGILNFIVKWGSGFNSFLQETFRSAANWILSAGASLFDRAISSVIEGAKRVFEGFRSWLIGNSFIPSLFNQVASYVRGAGTSAVSGAFGGLVNAIEGVLNGISLRGIDNAVNGIISKANEAVRSLGRIPNNVTTTHTVIERTRGSSISRTRTGDRYHEPDRSSGRTSRGSTYTSPEIHSERAMRGLHTGGIVNAGSGTLFNLHGREAVIPLNTQGVGVLAKALEKAGGGGRTVVIQGPIQVHADDADTLLHELEMIAR